MSTAWDARHRLSGHGAERDATRPPWWAVLLDLVLPAECAGCGATSAVPIAEPDRSADVAPAGGVPRRISGGLCSRCAKAFSGPPFLVARTGRPAGLPPVFALAEYRDPVPEIVVAQKERGRLDLPRTLGRRLAEAVLTGMIAAGSANFVQCNNIYIRAQVSSATPPPPLGWWLVPVPSTRYAVRRRGGDPIRAMARVCAAELRQRGAPVGVLPALRHVRRVADQAGLSRAERARNLAGALQARTRGAQGLAARPVVLVDDVLTSGATLTEAARAIRAAGGRPLCAAVLGVTIGRSGT